MTRLKKRFIAGATCPKCNSMDTLQLYFENNVEKMSCINCGYQQSQADQEIAAASKNDSGVIGVFKP